MIGIAEPSILGLAGFIFALVAFSKPHLLPLMRGVGIASILAVSLTSSLFNSDQAEKQATYRRRLGLDEPMPPPAPFRLSASAQDPTDVGEIRIDGNHWSIRYTDLGSPYREPREETNCEGSLRPRQAAKVLQTLEAIGRSIAAGELICSTGDYNIVFSDQDGRFGGDWSVEPSVECPTDTGHSTPSEIFDLDLLLALAAPVSADEERVVCELLPMDSSP